MEESQAEMSDDRSKFLNQEILAELARFVEYHPMKRFSGNLRRLLLEFLMYDGSSEAEYLRDICIDLDGLFDLLEVIDDHQRTLSMSVTHSTTKQ